MESKQKYQNEDLVLKVSSAVDPQRWDESKYDSYLDELCGQREYQKEAIRTVMRYLLGGKYKNLRDLAFENFKRNESLSERYLTIENFEKHLQFPLQLSASLDLATGTGKSFVMYAVAAIMLAEGAVDRVLVLCPSTTIESGLQKKFSELASNGDLVSRMPASAMLKIPSIINGSSSITKGSICIENYHAILSHVRSSIRDSLEGKGLRTLILNDEAHHVANAPASEIGKWKSFLCDPNFGFKYVIGVSGTCYVGNEYFSDVVYRYSLRQAMEQGFVKKIHYVAEMPDNPQTENEKWQLIYNRHNDIKHKLDSKKIRPISIIVTRDIKSCKEIAEKLKLFLAEVEKETVQDVEEKVLVVYTGAPDLMRLSEVDEPHNKVEWILSVSMLNEGWDVKRVFQIVPHEKRAFESKLLIAQVLGRGLRKPENWVGEQPTVTIFNHDKWAQDIRGLVFEVMEYENRVPTFVLPDSKYNFALLNIEYDSKPYIESYRMGGKYKLFAKGYVDLSTDKAIEEIKIDFEDADSGARTQWKTIIKHKTYSPREVAEIMYQRFEDLLESEDRLFYTKQFPIKKLEEIIQTSLKLSGNTVITEATRQKFLQSLGPLQRKTAQVVRYDFTPKKFYTIQTSERPEESANASELRNSKTLFFGVDTVDSISDEYKDFYKKVTEDGSGYKCIRISNSYHFKSPLNAVIADHENERKFIRELTSSDNLLNINAWIKSTPLGFYGIDYAWKKGTQTKRGRFSPDFFIQTRNLILVVEIKSNDEIEDISPENIKKYEYASKHFEHINNHLISKKVSIRYKLNFLTPSDFSNFFQSVKDGTIAKFRSSLDVELSK